MKKRLVVTMTIVGVLFEFWLAFMLGKHSYLIGKPQLLFDKKEEWLVQQATKHALEEGISEDRLKSPRLLDTIKVYFEGQAGIGGVEVTLVKHNGVPLEMSW